MGIVTIIEVPAYNTHIVCVCVSVNRMCVCVCLSVSVFSKSKCSQSSRLSTLKHMVGSVVGIDSLNKPDLSTLCSY